MSRPYNYSIFTFSVPADVIDQRLEYYGEKLILLEADRDVSFKLDDNSNDAIPLEKGQIIRLDSGFKQVFWSAVAGTDIIFQISAPGSLSIEGNNVNVNMSGNVVVASSGKTSTAVHSIENVTDSAASICAANTSRQNVLLKNTDDSVDVFIGFDADVTTLTGFSLAPGEAISFDYYTGAIFAICASTATLSVIEEG